MILMPFEKFVNVFDVIVNDPAVASVTLTATPLLCATPFPLKVFPLIVVNAVGRLLAVSVTSRTPK